MIHITMQGKGGVGKTVVAMLLAQNRRSLGIDVTCVDCDPVNTTLASYKGLGAERLELLDGGEIAPGAWDELVERIIKLPAGGDMIVDTGATTFVPLSKYMVSNELPAVLGELGHEVCLHVVVPGGPALADSLVGLEAILRWTEGARVVVWLNRYFGPLVTLDGKPVELEELPVYQDHADRIESVIELEAESTLFAEDFRELLSRKEVFAEAQDNPGYGFMTRQRLRLLEERLMDTISRGLGVPPAGLAENGEKAGKAKA